MALPGVTTILEDRFFTLTRTDGPVGPRVLAIARRIKPFGDTDDNGEAVVQDYDPYAPRSEKDVIREFGESSELHRAFVELVASGAARVALVALPEDTSDADLYDEDVFNLAFEAAESAQPDIIVPWGRGGGPTDWESPATPGNDAIGYHADNASLLTQNLAKLVSDRCQLITERSHPCFAVMGIAPYTATAYETMTANQINTHLTVPNMPDRSVDNFGKNGSYVSVVALEAKPAGYARYPEWGYSNGACIYAGFLSNLNSENAATGKTFDISALRYNPTRTQQQTLIDAGVVPVALNTARRPYWVDALTFGDPTSDYTRLTTLRIVFDAMEGVREATGKFIGQPASLENRNSMETAITTMLRGMTVAGAIGDSDFIVTYVPRESKAIVDLTLRPVFELRNIEIRISVDL